MKMIVRCQCGTLIPWHQTECVSCAIADLLPTRHQTDLKAEIRHDKEKSNLSTRMQRCPKFPM